MVHLENSGIRAWIQGVVVEETEYLIFFLCTTQLYANSKVVKILISKTFTSLSLFYIQEYLLNTLLYSEN